MDKDKEILSELTVYMKYAKYIPELNRRESWEELVERNLSMHIKKFPELEDEIRENYKYVFDKKILPSMRSLQFAGKAIEMNPARIFNCSFLPIDSIESFSETMFLLLSGTGVGYSVQKHHVEQLPDIRKPNPSRNRRFLISDNIQGWADAIKILIKSYTGKASSTVIFDYSDIRPKGALLVTAGGKAPGPAPLRECLIKITNILDNKQDGDKLKPIEAHSILCHIADAVLSGGIRRSALISLFNIDDEEMLSCKTGNWWELNPHFGRANNSAVVLRHKITKDKFTELWEKTRASGSGEPGIFFTNDKDWGGNPCLEISLRPYQFCNLVEVKASDIDTQEEFNNRVKAAAFIATLQASYTDFYYLRDIWQKTTEKEALIGVSLTGIASNTIFKLNIEEAAKLIKVTNKEVANKIGIKEAARTTCIKPAGTTSLVLGTSSGVHAYHSPYYLRRLRVGKNESIYPYLKQNLPDLVEDEYFRPHDTAIITIPQKSPSNAAIRTESALTLLDRVYVLHKQWIQPGHRKGSNTNNVSVTVSVKDNEWYDVVEWMWNNKEDYTGISVLPYNGGHYTQAPFEECSKEVYTLLSKYIHDIDLSKVVEHEDFTDLSGEISCGGGSCEIK